jgi:hypothetical protein
MMMTHPLRETLHSLRKTLRQKVISLQEPERTSVWMDLGFIQLTSEGNTLTSIPSTTKKEEEEEEK